MYVERSVDRLIEDLLRELPALLIVGPRACGKTTTARRHAASAVRLDRAAEAALFEADPDAALRGLAEPVLLDEWQAVPGVLGAVKRAVDDDPRPGRFLVTGSVHAELESPTWPGTGRLVRVPMWGMTVAERIGVPGRSPLIDRIVRGDDLRPTLPPTELPDVRDYIRLALVSGFPEAALTLTEGRRSRWMESYVEQLLTRDAREAEPRRDPARLRRYFEAYALNSAGVPDEKAIYEAAGINRRTAVAYEHLLANLMVAEPTPAWTSNRLKRLTRSPKRYLTDAALLAASVRLDAEGILRDGDLLGRVLDTFVMSQLRPESVLAEARARLYHLRQQEGRHEVDVLAEIGGGRIIAIEIKAAAAPDRAAARHLAALRDAVGEAFIAGVVLHTGPGTYPLGERLVAAPICTLWA